jgi:hypothetical protein
MRIGFLLIVMTVFSLGNQCSAQSTLPTETAPQQSHNIWERWDALDQAASSSRAANGRWFLSEYDFDSRGFNVLHFMGSSGLPGGFRIWGFIDIEGADSLLSNREDLSTYFLEIDVKRKLFDQVGLIAELNDLNGEDNAIGRFGFYWAPETQYLSKMGGRLAGDFKFGIKAFPIETDGEGGQFSFNWNKQFEDFLGGRFSAGGFFDLNVDAGPGQDDVKIVTEHQIRLRVFENLYVITEFRVNEFLSDTFGIAPGIQYRY